MEELLVAREEARRKLQQSQLRRRNLMNSLSRKWRRSSSSNLSSKSAVATSADARPPGERCGMPASLSCKDTIISATTPGSSASSPPKLSVANHLSRSNDNSPMMMKDSISSTTMLGIPNIITSNG